MIYEIYVNCGIIMMINIYVLPLQYFLTISPNTLALMYSIRAQFTESRGPCIEYVDNIVIPSTSTILSQLCEQLLTSLNYLFFNSI